MKIEKKTDKMPSKGRVTKYLIYIKIMVNHSYSAAKFQSSDSTIPNTQHRIHHSTAISEAIHVLKENPKRRTALDVRRAVEEWWVFRLFCSGIGLLLNILFQSIIELSGLEGT